MSTSSKARLRQTTHTLRQTTHTQRQTAHAPRQSTCVLIKAHMIACLN